MAAVRCSFMWAVKVKEAAADGGKSGLHGKTAPDNLRLG